MPRSPWRTEVSLPALPAGPRQRWTRLSIRGEKNLRPVECPRRATTPPPPPPRAPGERRSCAQPRVTPPPGEKRTKGCTGKGTRSVPSAPDIKPVCAYMKPPLDPQNSAPTLDRRAAQLRGAAQGKEKPLRDGRERESRTNTVHAVRQ